MNQRFNSVSCFLGRPGTGKTYQLLKIAQLYIKKGMRVFVVDDFDHPTYRNANVEIVKPENIGKLKPGIYRLISPDIEEEIIPVIASSIWNSLLVFEDCFKYVGNKFSKPMARLVIDAKQRNIDIIFMYHYWAWMALDLARRADSYMIFKTTDTPEARFDRKSFPFMDELLRIYNEVMKSPNEHEVQLFRTGINT